MGNNGTVTIPEGHWLCHWCYLYGNINPSIAFRPNSEEPVITAEKQTICQKCARTYWEGRQLCEQDYIRTFHPKPLKQVEPTISPAKE